MSLPIAFQDIQNHPFVLGLERSFLLSVVGQPVNVIKFKSQSHPSTSSLMIFKEIFNRSGSRGFMEGGTANFSRRFIRGAFNVPCIDYTQKMLNHSYPTIFTHDGTMSKVGAAALFAIFDSVFLYPIDLLMGYKIRAKTYRSFYKDRFVKIGIGSLYSGVKVNFVMQLTMWQINLVVSQEVQRKLTKIDKKNEYPHVKELITATTVATTLAFINLPMDFIRTSIQNDPALNQKKTTVLINELICKHGYRAFYSGVPFVWSYNVLSVLLLNRILNKILN